MALEGTSPAVVQISARGYRKYTINVPRLVFVENVARINIGNVKLLPTTLPRVRQVLSGQRADGALVFTVILENSLTRDVLIQELTLVAVRPGEPAACFDSVTTVFELDDTLVVTGGGKGKIDVSGRYVEKVRGSDYAIAYNGTAMTHSCDGAARLELTMPTAFVVPSGSLSAVQIVIPRQLRAVRRTPPSSHAFSATPHKDPTVMSLRGFGSFRFAFSTADRDELPIVATYPVVQR
jgi:hypothetical protein